MAAALGGQELRRLQQQRHRVGRQPGVCAGGALRTLLLHLHACQGRQCCPEPPDATVWCVNSRMAPRRMPLRRRLTSSPTNLTPSACASATSISTNRPTSSYCGVSNAPCVTADENWQTGYRTQACLAGDTATCTAAHLTSPAAHACQVPFSERVPMYLPTSHHACPAASANQSSIGPAISQHLQ